MIIHDHNRGGGEVDSDAAGLGREQVDERLFAHAGSPSALEAVDRELPVGQLDGSVEALEPVAAELEQVVDDVQHRRELGENQYLRAIRATFCEQLIEEAHLPGNLGECVSLA